MNMHKRSLSFVSLTLFSLLLIGCNRGCTTSTTLASESKTISTPEGDVEITGRVVDYRNSMPVNRNVFNRSISHTFGLSFDVKFGNFYQEDFFTEGVKDPDFVKLTDELKRVKVSVSKDKNHIALGIDGKVVDIIHLYQSHRITTNQQDLMADGTMDWSKLDINSYPSPEKILTKTLEKSCDILGRNDEAMIAFCDSKKPSDKIHRLLLKKWPDCQLAQGYYTDERVGEFRKNDKWRKQATKSALKALKKRESAGFDLGLVISFSLAVNSSELNKTVDSLLLSEWGKPGGVNYTSALISRMENAKNPMGKSDRKKVQAEAKSEFNAYLFSGKSNSNRDAQQCLEVLEALGDTMSVHKFIDAAFNKRPGNFNTRAFIDIAYSDMDEFTDYQQQMIIEKTPKRFESFPKELRSDYFSAIQDVMDCSFLKRMKKKYPSELDFNLVPFRCDK